MPEITPDEANEWLRRYFADDHDPVIDITWHVGPSDPAIYREVMEILFSAQPE